jgi:hypothetical protein
VCVHCLQEPSSQQGAGQSVAQAPSIQSFCTAAPIWELKAMRKLCHLTSLTYKMYKVTVGAVRLRAMVGRKQLHTCSLAATQR